MTTATWWDHWRHGRAAPTTADERDGRAGEAARPFAFRGVRRVAFSDLSLALKVALIPAITLLVMGVMLSIAAHMGERNTAALRALDLDVFEPLNRAQTTKDGITLLHARLFALLSLGNNEFDAVAQRARAEKLTARLDTETKNFSRFLGETSAVPPESADRLRASFAAYAMRVRETIDFAAYDSSYGALYAGITADQFGLLSANLDALVQLLAQRRLALAEEVVGGSLRAQHLLLGLDIGAAMLVLLSSVVVGRSIARPVLGLTTLMNRLAGGDTDLVVPGSERRDEVGAMARAVEVFRANAIAHRLGEFALRRTNLMFDAALNSMQQGLIVWGSDNRVQLVNRRYFEIFGTPQGNIGDGLTVREVVDISLAHGNHPGQDPSDICDKVTRLLTTRRSMQVEMEVRADLFLHIATEPMANGGVVITFDDVSEKHQTAAQIAFMARHDALTNLPNRRMFQEHLEAAVDQLAEGRQFAALFLDLDHFKEVNDTLGHPVGDELLRLVAGRLRRCVRDRDVIARLGGDEFAIVMDGAAEGQTAAIALGSRLVQSIAAPYELLGRDIVIGTSIGIALSEPGLPSIELLKQADVALYRAKEERGTVAFFDSSMNEHLNARRGLEADLRSAVQRGEFEVHYQPLYSLRHDRVTAFEALLRWNSPTRGHILPDVFIALAEQTGLIVPIGDWVMRTACAEAAPWPDHVRVAVNLSAVQFKNKRLAATVRGILQDTGLPARRLELEITETVLLQDTEAVMTMLRDLHDLGVRVAMDDFGTGYSSLSYLHRFPFDAIKIDRSFVSDLRVAPSDAVGSRQADGILSQVAKSAAMIVRSITVLGENLGISTTAEGVETIEQFTQLRQQGCSEVQGYFISRPRPAAELEALRQQLDTTLPAIVGRHATAGSIVHGTVLPVTISRTTSLVDVSSN